MWFEIVDIAVVDKWIWIWIGRSRTLLVGILMKKTVAQTIE